MRGKMYFRQGLKILLLGYLGFSCSCTDQVLHENKRSRSNTSLHRQRVKALGLCLGSWQVEGVASVSQGRKRLFFNFHWLQQDTDYQVNMGSSWQTKDVSITGNTGGNDGVWLVAFGRTAQAFSLEALAQGQLGIVGIPFSYLPYWFFGIAPRGRSEDQSEPLDAYQINFGDHKFYQERAVSLPDSFEISYGNGVVRIKVISRSFGKQAEN